MVTVNKDAVVRAVAEKTGLPLSATKSVIDAFTDHVGTAAAEGATIRLMGFGSFSVKARPARTGRNPKTGEAVAIPETRRLVFKASKAS
ncbi:MAG: HU family DNA-binding protein [Albidovulum sp.]|jgi:DNA-binding protein HU-beta